MKMVGYGVMALGLGAILFSFFQGAYSLPAENLQDQMDNLEHQRVLAFVQLLGCLSFIAGALFACTGLIMGKAMRP